MFRIPVRGRNLHVKAMFRAKSSSSYIRSTFIDYFTQNHGHKHVKSSSVVPLCDPSVPFVNAGMNQFKGVFLGRVEAPCARAVNSQKCVRVGGKHNDLEVVGADGHHHTFFEMLGNWSFGDYYKKEACRMAWDLLLGPYRFKPEELVVTYFAGDAAIDIPEDRECRDIWREIGVPASRLKALGVADNFWEMGGTGPCGPCTEIHHVGADGRLTEIWNIVFIQCNREADGSVRRLRRRHVDTGLGLERVAALAQGARSNYDTDLFRPIIRAIERNSGGEPYGGRFGPPRDAAYRRLADHARMLAVCLADGVYPNTSLNLKQIMRKSFKIATDVFQNPQLLRILYDEVAASLGPTYPELVARGKEVKLILEHEEQAYARMRATLGKRWRELLARYPEAEALAEVEAAGLALGYTELKEVMAKQKSPVIPGELVFKLYDTHGLQEDIIDKIAAINNMTVDKEGFHKLLARHRNRHKTAIKEQTANKAAMFDQAIDSLIKNNIPSTNDAHKYNYTVSKNEINFPSLKTKAIAILNEHGEWIDVLEPIENHTYYVVTKDTNFYCEEGGQIADSGFIRLTDKATLKVDSVFKIRDFVFHKGCFTLTDNDRNYVRCNSDVLLEIDSEKRLKIMRNHTAVHLLNAAVRRVLPNSVVCQVGSSVTDESLSLSLSVYGQKLTQDVVMRAQELIRESIQANSPVECRVVDSLQVTSDVVTVPGETYPAAGLRLVTAAPPLPSKELCCGTHVPSTGHVGEFCVTLVKAAGGNTPTIHAITGPKATEARELFCQAHQLYKVADLVEEDRRKTEVADIKRRLSALCAGSGAPFAEYSECLATLDKTQKRALSNNDLALNAMAEEEIRNASLEAAKDGRNYIVHFLRCSYIMPSDAVSGVLRARADRPALLLGCAGGVVGAAARVPQEFVSESFTAERWLQCVLRVFGAPLAPPPPGQHGDTFAEMTATKVSLITCEQLVQEAARAAGRFAARRAGAGARGRGRRTSGRHVRL